MRLHNNGERALNLMTKGGKRPFLLTVWGARKGDDISEWQWKRMEKVNLWLLYKVIKYFVE